MRFYDRETEIRLLEEVVKGEGSSMVVISGRRRVGKSRLVDEFMRVHPGIRVIAVPKEEKQVAADMAGALSDGYRPVFNTVREALEYFFAKSESRMLYVDEFPNLLEANKAIPYELQRIWEIYKDRTDKIIVLSGSYVSMMDRIFTRQKAPLFNRANPKILLEPLGHEVVWEIQKESLGIGDPVRRIANYCIFGGIPYYYEVLEKQHDKAGDPEALFFGTGQLREEGQDVLRQEFGSAYAKYFSILEAIGSGIVASGEIANKMGVRQTTLSKYIAALQNDFRLLRRTVPFGQNPSRSKKGIYLIKDNLLAFWFSMVYGKEVPPSVEDVNLFVSRRFELLCMDFMIGVLRKRGEQVRRSGRWWGNVEVEAGRFEQREIDLVIETERNIYVGECKWSGERVGEKELVRLRQSAGIFGNKKAVKLALFSKSGFSIKGGDDVLLFDAAAISP